MSNPTYFVQECPTCGRCLQIRVEYLGKKVVCQHCLGQLIATDPETLRPGRGQTGNPLLEWADELLASLARRKMQPRQYPR